MPTKIDPFGSLGNDGLEAPGRSSARLAPPRTTPQCGIDYLFLICSHISMTRIDEEALSLHLEVALAGTAPRLLGDLSNPDRYRRGAAVADVARQLAERLRCFDIQFDEPGLRPSAQPSLFPPDLGPMG